jgi:CelD/BcsL family acetyltransferase involved in cellulose biosynthesis
VAGADVSGLRPIELDDDRWRSFVAGRPEATPFHTPAWAEMLCECYGFRGFALASLDENGLPHAGIPVIEFPAPLRRRRRWVSLPFTDVCAPLSSEPEREGLLLESLEDARRVAEVDRFEIRSHVEVGAARRITTGLRHTLALERNEDAVLRRLDRSQVQRNIERAKREGVVVRRGEQEADLDHVFFQLQVETRRRLGVPVQPRRFYTLLWRRVIERGHGFLLLAYAGGTAIAGGVFLRAPRTLTYKYGASNREYWRLRPNILLFWTAIQIGCRSGAEILDFGRTDLNDQGLRTFKLNWGTHEEPLTYTVLGRPDGGARQRFEPVVRNIIRYSPSWVCRTIGATLYRYAA